MGKILKIIELFLLCCSWSFCSSPDVSRCRNPRQESRPCCLFSVHRFSLHPRKYHLKEGACSNSSFLTRIPFFEIMISTVPGLHLHNSCRLGRKCSFDIDKKLFHWDLMQSVPWNVKIKTRTCILECESKIQTTIWRKIFFQHLPVFFGVEFKMPLLALYCSVVIATVGVLFFLFFRASFSDLI